MIKRLLLICICLIALTPFCALVCGQSATIAFYNTENLCDTVDSPLIDDSDFTPKGKNHWNTERYNQKLSNIAQVIDDLNADVIGLSEIENETVVRDLLLATKSGYNYIHRNTSDYRGIDQVLLYRGDTFFPDKVRQVGGNGVSREFLVVEGELLDEKITLIVCHMPSLLNSSERRTAAARSLRRLIDSILEQDPEANLVVMGDFNASPNSALTRKETGILPLANRKNNKPGSMAGRGKGSDSRDETRGKNRVGNVADSESGTNRANSGDFPHTSSKRTSRITHPLYTPFARIEQQGYGTYVYRDKRYVYDYIALSQGLLRNSGLKYGNKTEIFVRDYLIHTQGTRAGYPVRSFDKGKYTAGYSDHLPVLLHIGK